MPYGPKPTPLAERLAAGIDTSGGPDACHPWTRSTDPKGYGMIRLSQPRGIGKVHRLVLEAAAGPPPDATRSKALHSCDWPTCANPRHLRWGSQHENVQDAVERKAMNQGEKHGKAKLTEAAVRALREDRRNGSSLKELGAKYGIDPRSAGNIARGVTWKHLLP